jgi:hypothetical protein
MIAWLTRYVSPKLPNHREALILATIAGIALAILLYVYVLPKPE